MLIYLHKNKLLVSDTALATADNCCCNCYRKETETGDPEEPICYTFVCQQNHPGDGWVKISQGCENCGEIIECSNYTQWQIIDTNGYLYAQGPIGSSPPDQVLIDLPQPFIPLFYDAPAGPRSFKLQAKCGLNQAWHTMEEWDDTITLCGTTNNRYPQHPWLVTWLTQDPCDIARTPEGQKICEYSQPCSNLSYVAGNFDGQEWRDPDHTIAVTFTGAEDGEWTNLANWEDAGGRSPARFLPDSNSDIIIDNTVSSKPIDFIISVKSITINNNKIFAIEASCETVLCYGEIASSASNICGEPYKGKVSYSVSATLDGGILSGELIQLGVSRALFNNNSSITSNGKMIGNAKVDNLSTNEGTITGNAEFDNASRNKTGGVVEGDAVFRNGSMNTQATVEGNAQFYNDSANSFATVEGNAEFYDTSTNDSNAVVQGNATFNNSSSNMNTATVQGTSIFNTNSSNLGLCQDQATFNDNSSNALGGVCQSNDNIFNGTSTNSGVANGATFNANARNTSTGVINNAAIFNDNSENEGDADGGATFNGSSINDTDGRASGATFNTNAKNKGEVMGSAIFNGSSINDTTGTVTNNATFNDSSRNKGNVIGTATFDWPNACNDGGTAGTFIPADPTCP